MDVGNIVDDQNGNISVNIPISEGSSFSGEGLITYLYFLLGDSPGALTNLSLTEALVTGGIPKNIDISAPVIEGQIVILQTNYEISGQVFYYDSPDELSSPFEVPNVKLSLDKN